MNTTRRPVLGDVFHQLDDEGLIESTIGDIVDEKFDEEAGLIIEVVGDIDDASHEIRWDDEYNCWVENGLDLSDFDFGEAEEV